MQLTFDVTPMQGSKSSDTDFMQLPNPEDQHMHMEAHAPGSRMFRTMSVPHIAMGPTHHGSYNGGEVSSVSIAACLFHP